MNSTELTSVAALHTEQTPADQLADPTERLKAPEEPAAIPTELLTAQAEFVQAPIDPEPAITAVVAAEQIHSVSEVSPAVKTPVASAAAAVPAKVQATVPGPVATVTQVAPVAVPAPKETTAPAPAPAASAAAATSPAAAPAPSGAAIGVAAASARSYDPHQSSRSHIPSVSPLMTTTSNHPQSPKWSLCGRTWANETASSIRTAKLPGPGAYDLPVTPPRFSTSSKLVFDKTPRFSAAQKEKAPGVGAYDPKFALMEPQPLRVPFGTSQRPQMATKAESQAGPGSYKIPSLVCETPGVSMKGRNWVKTSQSVLVNVGPGEYGLPVNRPGSLFSFGKAERKGWGGKSVGPAVGTYDVAGWRALGKEGTKVSISGRPMGWGAATGRGGAGKLGPGEYNAATTSFGH